MCFAGAEWGLCVDGRGDAMVLACDAEGDGGNVPGGIESVAGGGGGDGEGEGGEGAGEVEGVYE